MKLKSLFSTPKKTILTIIFLIAILIVAGTMTAFAAEEIAKSTSIGTVAAQDKALSDAGVSKERATFTTTEFEFEKGNFVYDVEFTADGIEYDYIIKASNGTVLSRKATVADNYISQENAQSQPSASTQTDKYIGIDAAKSKALDDAKVKTSNATFTEQKLDTDDGIAVYEIGFYTADKEYDYEINAITGDIHKKSSQTINSYQSDTQNKDEKISLDSAKKKALSDAGVKANEVTFTKQKLDWDDGISIYEIEFYTSSKEYDYEINANTGAIHEKSIEPLQTSQRPQKENNNSYISIEKVKSLALSHAGFSANEVYLSKNKFENDDDIMVYEIEFIKDNIEYEYTIHAVSGKILEFDYEYDD